MRRFLPAAVFILGMLLGVSMTTIFFIKRAEKLVNSDTSTLVLTATSLTAARLGLSEEQKVKLRPVAQKMVEQFEALRSHNMPAVRNIIETAAAEAEPILTPAQRNKLDDLLARPRERWKNIREISQPLP